MNQTVINIPYFPYQEEVFFDWPEGVRFKIVTKGRRAGFTNGAANAVIETLLTKGGPILWVDTVQGNIKKYFRKYFKPLLKRNNIEYTWNDQDKQLVINGQSCDFRSEEQGENIEGFGYRLIIMNEAGIILRNKHFYVESILPMLLDYPDSKLIAGGVPKGKRTKKGEPHLFYELFKRCVDGVPGYKSHHVTARDNPNISNESVKALADEMYALGGQKKVDQEVEGEFTDTSSDNPFLIHFERTRHVGPTQLDRNKKLYLSIDFNLRPFALGVYHKWRDNEGEHAHKVAEHAIEQGSMSKMIKLIQDTYGPWIPNLAMTGDRNGKKKELSQDDNASNFLQLQRALRLRDSQIVVPANPTHVKSSNDCNYILANHPDFKYGDHCTESIFDAENVEVDQYGSIIKGDRKDAAQRADHLDTDRYFMNTFLSDWVEDHQKRAKK